MRNREALRLAGGETVRLVPTSITGGPLARQSTYVVAYVDGPSFCPWVVTTDRIRFAPWEVEPLRPIAQPETRQTQRSAARR